MGKTGKDNEHGALHYKEVSAYIDCRLCACPVAKIRCSDICLACKGQQIVESHQTNYKKNITKNKILVDGIIGD